MDAKEKIAEEKADEKKRKEVATDWEDDEIRPTPVARKRKGAPTMNWSDEEIEPSQKGASRKLNFDKKKNKNHESGFDSQFMVEDETDDSE